jgi:CRP-like cAMP-binding protein
VAHLHLLHSAVNPSPRNRLLAALPAEDLARVWPRLEPVELTVRQVIQAPEEPITAVYFPESGWVSMLALLADGGAAEVGVIGREGMAGLPLLFGADMSSVEGLVQAPGPALRLSAVAFREELEHIPALRTLLLRYALAFQEQVAQTAACNGRHVLEQRLARWLLMAHDRAEGDEFPMTQDFLAMMLCVHRPGVTVAARMLQQAGYIRYGAGHITVADSSGLEEVACECYGTVRRQFERLLGAPQASLPMVHRGGLHGVSAADRGSCLPLYESGPPGGKLE